RRLSSRRLFVLEEPDFGVERRIRRDDDEMIDGVQAKTDRVEWLTGWQLKREAHYSSQSSFASLRFCGDKPFDSKVLAENLAPAKTQRRKGNRETRISRSS